MPSDVLDERVWSRRDEYVKKYCDSFDKEGWELKSEVSFLKRTIPLTADIREGRTRWQILAYWDRKPIKQVFEVDEKIIPKLLETGEFSLV